MTDDQYVIIIRPDGSHGDTAVSGARVVASVGAHNRYDMAEVEVYCGSANHFDRVSPTAAFIGDKFQCDPSQPSTSVAGAEARSFRIHDTTRIVFKFWGRFLYLQIDERSGIVRIYRDPSGSCQAYFGKSSAGCWVISSSARAMCEIIDARPTIAWDAIARHLARPHFRSGETCLQGVSEIPAGSLLSVGADGATVQQYWSPWYHADPARWFGTEEEATVAVREAVNAAVAALASRHKHTLLALSGGLDSSIVAAALVAAKADFSAINMATMDATGDERTFATLVAQSLDIELHIAMEDAGVVDLWHSDAAHLPRPTACSYTQSADRKQVALARAKGATGYFSGGGGDHIFCYLHSCTPLIDRIRVGRSDRSLWSVAADISRMTGVSLPSLWFATAKRMGRRTNRYRCPTDLSLLSEAAHREASCFPMHPWGSPPANMPPGKVMHVAWLQQIHNHLEGYGRERDLPIEWPLMSQPVVETCLRVPTWMWCSGGINRAVARNAFRQYLPKQIVDRVAKGSPESVMVQSFEQNREEIFECLLDGHLVANGVVERDSLLGLRHVGSALRPAQLDRIMTILDVEIWIRSWER